MSTGTRRLSRSTKRIVGVAVLVAILVAMVLDTKFLSPEAEAKLNPPPFTAESYAKEKFPEVTAAIKQKATDIAVLAPAVEADVAAAGKQYGQDLGSGAYAFPVKATGTADEVDANFVLLKVPGVPAGTAVRIPVGAAVSGTPVRDATGNIKFGDFAGQTDFQSVANQFKIRIQQDVLSKVDPASLKGKQVTVYGAWATGGPPKSFIIQPVEIEVR
jgi:predicted lipoprotein